MCNLKNDLGTMVRLRLQSGRLAVAWPFAARGRAAGLGPAASFAASAALAAALLVTALLTVTLLLAAPAAAQADQAQAPQAQAQQGVRADLKPLLAVAP